MADLSLKDLGRSGPKTASLVDSYAYYSTIFVSFFKTNPSASAAGATPNSAAFDEKLVAQSCCRA